MYTLSLALAARLPHAGGDTPRCRCCHRCRCWSAPRRWGYTADVQCKKADVQVCPTQVGIHRNRNRISETLTCLPHAGGDTPDGQVGAWPQTSSAPRRWGYTSCNGSGSTSGAVCPTQVGIHLNMRRYSLALKSLPHAGGDTPAKQQDQPLRSPSAPRRWGYTRYGFSNGICAGVCPTQVGIHHRIVNKADPKGRLPHAGGDTPLRSSLAPRTTMSAPRRWGYTGTFHVERLGDRVCPTQVGIHPIP